MNRNTEKLIEISRTKKILCISSKTQDDNHILIWDFDNIELYHILKSLSKTQGFNGLGIIYIFKTNNGYNAICLDKLPIEEAYNIKLYTRWSDYWHTNIGYKQGNWSWKISTDKKCIKHLLPTDSYKNRVGSLAHKEFLENQFTLKINNGTFDNYSKLDIESYKQDVI